MRNWAEDWKSEFDSWGEAAFESSGFLKAWKACFGEELHRSALRDWSTLRSLVVSSFEDVDAEELLLGGEESAKIAISYMTYQLFVGKCVAMLEDRLCSDRNPSDFVYERDGKQYVPLCVAGVNHGHAVVSLSSSYRGAITGKIFPLVLWLENRDSYANGDKIGIDILPVSKSAFSPAAPLERQPIIARNGRTGEICNCALKCLTPKYLAHTLFSLSA